MIIDLLSVNKLLLFPAMEFVVFLLKEYNTTKFVLILG